MEKLYVEESGKKRLAEEITCDFCGEKFLRSKVRIRRNKKKGVKNNFCSTKCANLFRRNRIEVECAVCNKKFEVIETRYKKSKSGFFFCSKECKDFG